MSELENQVAELRSLLESGEGPRVLAWFHEWRPEEIAVLLREVDDHEVDQVFELLREENEERAADVLACLERHDIVRVLEDVPTGDAADLIEQLPSDDAAHVLDLLSDERADEIVAKMEREEAEEVRQKLDYPDDSAGRIMSEEFIALPPEATAGDAIRRLQEAGEDVTIVYVYLTDPRGVLQGVVSIRSLLRGKPDRRLSDLSPPPDEIVKVLVTDDQEAVAHVLSQNDYMCVPVVDPAGKLLGVVTYDDAMDVLRYEATEDMLQMAGTSPEDVIRQSVWSSARLRMPWLLFALGSGVVAMRILDFYGRRMESLFTALVLFLPVIAGMGGNVGTQSATVVVRGLATGRLRRHDAVPVLLRELGTALLIGLCYGLLLAVVASVFLDEPLRFSIVVGAALLFAMLLAATIGSLLPVFFHRIGVDPAVATGPLVTTSVDILGILIYLNIAAVFLVK